MEKTPDLKNITPVTPTLEAIPGQSPESKEPLGSTKIEADFFNEAKKSFIDSRAKEKESRKKVLTGKQGKSVEEAEKILAREEERDIKKWESGYRAAKAGMTEEDVQPKSEDRGKKEAETTKEKLLTRLAGSLKKEVEKKEAETTKEKLYADIDKWRSELVKREAIYKEAKKKGIQGESILEMDFEKAKKSYENAKNDYARFMYKEKLSLLEGDKGRPEYDQELSELKGALFRDVIIREQDELAKARYGNLEPRKKTWFRSLLGNYIKAPMWKRVAISTAMVTGTIATGGLVGGLLGLSMGFAGGAATLGYGTQRFVRGMIGGATGGYVGGWVKRYFGKKVEEDRDREINALQGSFGMRIEKINSDREFKDMMLELNNEYERITREINRRHKKITLWASGAAIVAGFGTASGVAAAHLDGPLSDYLNTKLGLSTETNYNAPSKMTSFGFPAVTDHELPKTTGAPDNLPIDIKETIAAAKLDEIVVQKDDSLWGIIDQKLEDVYGSQFESLKPAQKMYIVDSIKDEIARNPETYGLKNIDQLQVGQKIDLSGVITDHKISSALDAAKHLTDEQIKNIHEASLGVKAEPKIIDGAPVEDYSIEEDGAIIEGAPVIQEEVGKILKIAPEYIEKVLAKISETDKNMLMSVAGKEGGMEKFLKMPASNFFWDDTFGSPPYYREQVGNILKKIAGGDNPILKTNTPIGEIIRSIKK